MLGSSKFRFFVVLLVVFLRIASRAAFDCAIAANLPDIRAGQLNGLSIAHTSDRSSHHGVFAGLVHLSRGRQTTHLLGEVHHPVLIDERLWPSVERSQHLSSDFVFRLTGIAFPPIHPPA